MQPSKHRVTLTVRNVPTLSAQGGRVSWWDKTLPGFYLRVSAPSPRYPKGVRAYGVWYRVRGRALRATLGRHPVVGLKAARDRARAILEAARLRGEDIARHDRTAPDLVAIIERWSAATAKDKAAATTKEELRIAAKVVKPSAVAGRPVETLKRDDLRGIVAGLVKKSPASANRAHQRICSALAWAMDEEIIIRDPSRGWERPAVEGTNDRYLRDEEVVRLWAVCSDVAGDDRELAQRALLLQFLLALGQRSTESGLARAADVTGDVWIIPAEHRKGRKGKKRAHAVPVTPVAAAVLERARALSPSSLRFFPFYREENRDWPSTVRTRIGLAEHWTPHNLRTTCATGMGALGVTRTDIALVLSHTIREGGAVTHRYDLHERMREKRAALTLWSAHLLKLIEG